MTEERFHSSTPNSVTFQRLAEIGQSIIGPRPTLWLPNIARPVFRKTGTRFAVVQAYSELTNQPRSAAEFWDELVECQTLPVLQALSAINILLERFTPSVILDEALISKFLGSTLQKLPSAELGPSPDYHLVFN